MPRSSCCQPILKVRLKIDREIPARLLHGFHWLFCRRKQQSEGGNRQRIVETFDLLSIRCLQARRINSLKKTGLKLGCFWPVNLISLDLHNV